jgi:hypothetical protein
VNSHDQQLNENIYFLNVHKEYSITSNFYDGNIDDNEGEEFLDDMYENL